MTKRKSTARPGKLRRLNEGSVRSGIGRRSGESTARKNSKTPPARSAGAAGKNRPSTARNTSKPSTNRSTAKPRATSSRSPAKATSARQRRSGVTVLDRVKSVSPRIVIAIILLGLFLAFSFGPTMRNIGATSELKKQESELRRQRELTASLKKEVRDASSLKYVEEEARRQRLVLPGETLYLVTRTDKNQPDVKYRVAGFKSMAEAWDSVRRRMNCAFEGRGRGQ